MAWKPWDGNYDVLAYPSQVRKHSAIAFDPIGIYLWHTLAAELHPLGDKRVYDSTSCDPVNSRSVKGHEVIFWCRWLLKLFRR